jgi:hypothetical protein
LSFIRFVALLRANHFAGMQRLFDMMLREGTLDTRSVSLLLELVDDKDSVLLAAFQVDISLSFCLSPL